MVVGGLLLLGFVMFQAWRHDRDMRAEHQVLENQTSSSRLACESDLTRFRNDVEQAAPLDELGEWVDEDWSAAKAALSRAEDALARAASSPQPVASLEKVTFALEQGRAALARVQANLVGDEPHDAPPCFFNPNHGPSSTTVSWTTADGTRVRVPSCGADVLRIQSGADPYWRTVAVDDLRLPWWQAGANGAPWARGWFARWHNHPLMASMVQAAPVLRRDEAREVSRAA